MQDPILQWMEATRTGVWMAVENSIKLVTLVVVGWFVYLVVVVPVRAEIAHWMAVWRRYQRIKKSAPVGADAEEREPQSIHRAMPE